VVALGDGYASGEGDGYASREGDTDYYDFDEQCHRSSHAWPAIVARRLESATTTVTFLSFACARAQLRHLYLSEYGGVEPDGLLDPQLVAARRAIGNPLDAATRQVDVLLIGAGRDDLGFNRALKACRFSIATDCRDGLSVRGLQESYEDLEVGISATMRVGRTVIADYPARIFTNGSDDHDTWAYRSYEFMSDNEAQWITEWGEALNSTIARAAAANGWRSVPTTDAFRGHGYCASIEEEMVNCDDIRVLEPDCTEWTTIQESFFVYAANDARHVHQELKAKDGIINPTTDGHAAVAAQVLGGPLVGASAPAPQRLTVRLRRVRVTDLGYDLETGAEARPWDRKVDFTVDWQANVCGHATLNLENVLPGSWIDVSSNPCARYDVATVGSTIKLRASTALGRFIFQDTEIDPGESSPPDLKRDRGYLVRRAHLRSSGFDASPALGRPTDRKLMRLRDSHDGGTLEIEYTITSPADESDPAAESAITAQQKRPGPSADRGSASHAPLKLRRSATPPGCGRAQIRYVSPGACGHARPRCARRG
jgi:hypothetical protein